MKNTVEEIESTTSYADWYTTQLLQQQQRINQKPQIDWFRMIPILIFLGVTAFFITKIIKTAKRNRQKRREERAAQAEAEKAERLATEERRHQEILQAIRESGKAPEDSQK